MGGSSGKSRCALPIRPGACRPFRRSAPRWLAGVQSPVVQHVVVRVDPAFQACFRRVRTGEERPGYRRLRGTGREDRNPLPHVPGGGKRATEPQRRRLMNVGRVHSVWQRPREGAPKTATSQRSSTGKKGEREGSLAGECAEPALLPKTGHPVGRDERLKPV